MPELSIVIPTLGNHAGLARALDALETQGPLERFEVLVVADAAEPEPERVTALAAARPYAVRSLRGRIPGASANRNEGWRRADAPVVLFMDDDTLAMPGLVDGHLAWHHRHPQAETGVLGHVRWARELNVTTFMHWLDHGVQFGYPAIKGVDAGWSHFYTANASVKRELLEDLGGFDEERLPYLYEDLDLAYRARGRGFRLLYNREAEVEHLREMDLDYWRRKMPRLAAAERTFVELHPDFPPYFYEMFTAACPAPP